TGGALSFKDGEFRRLDFARDKQMNSLFAEPDGTLWASCEDRTVLRYHAGRTEVLEPVPESTTRLVAHFATDGNARVWVGGRSFSGHYEAGRLVKLNEDTGSSDFRVATGRDGRPWVFAQDELLKLEEGRLRPVLKLPKLAGAHYVQAALEDREGTLWIGTRS